VRPAPYLQAKNDVAFCCGGGALGEPIRQAGDGVVKVNPANALAVA
jgi:hypothetical protein